jgi:NADPH2:quinone reductase
LEFADVEEPSPARNQVLVKVEAAGVNFIDTYQRGGLYETELPYVLGLEGSGTVIEVGRDVTAQRVGDRVAWASGPGSYAEKVAVDSVRLVPVPEGVSFQTAAAVMLQGLTAHYLVTDTFPLGPSHTCLIHAGAGGVGLLLTQMAKTAGATVVTTVGSLAKAKLSRGAGADLVVVYSNAEFGEEVVKEFGEKPFDVVYDGVGQATFLRSLDLLRPRGMMVTYGNASGPVPEVSPLLLARKGSIFLTRPTLRDYVATREELLRRCTDIFKWVQEGKLNVRIGALLKLWEAAKAHRALEGRETTGKVLLEP